MKVVIVGNEFEPKNQIEGILGKDKNYKDSDTDPIDHFFLIILVNKLLFQTYA